MNVLRTGGNRGLGFEFIKVFSKTGNNVAIIIRSDSARKIIKNIVQNIPYYYPILRIIHILK